MFVIISTQNQCTSERSNTFILISPHCDLIPIFGPGPAVSRFLIFALLSEIVLINNVTFAEFNRKNI